VRPDLDQGDLVPGAEHRSVAGSRFDHVKLRSLTRRVIDREVLGGPLEQVHRLDHPKVADGAEPSAPSADVWSTPEGDPDAQRLGELPLEPGARLPLLEVRSGPEDSTATGADGYDLWYRLALPDGDDGWVQAAIPSSFETGSDGEPASVRFDVLPAAAAS
jgi:hypothetical protein